MAIGGTVLAQDAGVPPPVDKKEAGQPTVEVPLRTRANITPADMTQQVEVYFKKMDEILRHMVGLQDVARRAKDVIKLNCVNDKLLQLRTLRNIADTANGNLQEAIARGDEEARYHEFGRITIVQQQAEILSTEAENCIGEELTFLGKTQVEVVEPEIPDEPTVVTGPDFPVVEPLPVASPSI